MSNQFHSTTPMWLNPREGTSRSSPPTKTGIKKDDDKTFTTTTTSRHSNKNKDILQKRRGTSRRSFKKQKTTKVENEKKEDGEKEEENLEEDPVKPVVYGPAKPNMLAPEVLEMEYGDRHLYKTEMCRSWIEKGECRYGKKCQFAHGKNELRPVVRHRKYKKEFCKYYHQDGLCLYGTRCCFIHESTKVDRVTVASCNVSRILSSDSRLPVFEELSLRGGNNGGKPWFDC